MKKKSTLLLVAILCVFYPTHNAYSMGLFKKLGSSFKNACKGIAECASTVGQPLEQAFRKVRNVVLYPVNKALLWLQDKANENDDVKNLMKHGTVEISYGINNNEATLRYTPNGSGQSFTTTIHEGDDTEAKYAEFTEKAIKGAEELRKAREELQRAQEENAEAINTYNAAVNAFEQSEHDLQQSQYELAQAEEDLTHKKSENKIAQKKVDEGHKLVDATRQQTLEARAQAKAKQTQYVWKAEKTMDDNQVIAYSISLVEEDVIQTPLATEAQMVMPSPYAWDETCHMNPSTENLLNNVKSLEDFDLGMEKVYGTANASGFEGVITSTNLAQDVMLGIAGAIAKHGDKVAKGAKAAGGAILIDEVAFDGAISECMNDFIDFLAQKVTEQPSLSDVWDVEMDLSSNPIYEAERERQKQAQKATQPSPLISKETTQSVTNESTPTIDNLFSTAGLQSSAAIPQDPVEGERTAPPAREARPITPSTPSNTHTIVVSTADLWADIDKYMEELNEGDTGSRVLSLPVTPPQSFVESQPQTAPQASQWADKPAWEKESSPVRLSQVSSFGQTLIGDDTDSLEEEETLKPNPPPVRPPVPPYDLWSRDDEMASVEQDVPPAPYTGIWSEEEWEYLETIGSAKLIKVEEEFLAAMGYSVADWENSVKPKQCLFELDGGPYRLVKTLQLLCKPNKKLEAGENKKPEAKEVHHMPAYASIKNAIKKLFEQDEIIQTNLVKGFDKALKTLLENFKEEATKVFWHESGPSVLMTYVDHFKTASYRNSDSAKKYREIQSRLIYKGRYRDAIDMDIDDLRNNFGGKYEKGIHQMEVYIQILENTVSATNVTK